VKKVIDRRRKYWNEPKLGWWESFYLFEVVRGLSITGGVFLRNMKRWMTGGKGALTAYYPEEIRADYAAHNRGKHVLTQRPDGRPQCVACNLCATVCPARVIEIEAGFDPDDPAHPKFPRALRDRLLALHLLRLLRRGLPGGCHPHGAPGAGGCRSPTGARACGWAVKSC
jgi:ferredoxin